MATLEMRYANRLRVLRADVPGVRGGWVGLEVVTGEWDGSESPHLDGGEAARAWRRENPREPLSEYVTRVARLTFCDEPASDAYDAEELSPSMPLDEVFSLLAEFEGLERVTVDGGEVWSIGAACEATADNERED